MGEQQDIAQTVLDRLAPFLPGLHLDTQRLPEGTLVVAVSLHRPSRLVRHYVAYVDDTEIDSYFAREDKAREIRKAIRRLGREPRLRFNVFPRKRPSRMRGK